MRLLIRRGGKLDNLHSRNNKVLPGNVMSALDRLLRVDHDGIMVEKMEVCLR